MKLLDNYPLHFLCLDLFVKASFYLLSSTLACPSRCYSCHPFVLHFFHVMLEHISANNLGLHLPCLLSNHFSGYLYVALFYFVSLCSWFFQPFSIFIVTLFCSLNVAPKPPTFFCARLFAAFNFSIQLLVDSFLILLEQSVCHILFNSLIIPSNFGGLSLHPLF